MQPDQKRILYYTVGGREEGGEGVAIVGRIFI
jgi:hypothetical protein